jgi:hypothetical protein
MFVARYFILKSKRPLFRAYRSTRKEEIILKLIDENIKNKEILIDEE